MKYVILSFFTLIFWVGLYLYIYLGFSKPVTVELADSPPITLIFKEHVGAYHKVAPVIESVERELREAGIICATSFGEFFDDPKEVAEDRLKSRVGCAFLEDGEILSEVVKIYDLKKDTIERRQIIKAQFRGSPSVGPMKVYPKIREFANEKRLIQAGPTIELYEMQGDEMITTYLQPVQSH